MAEDQGLEVIGTISVAADHEESGQRPNDQPEMNSIGASYGAR